MNGFSKFMLVVLPIWSLGSCVSYQSFVNFSEPPGIPDQPQTIANYQPILVQPNDILQIQVSSTDPTSVAPFRTAENSGESAGYLVNSEGEIKFPTIGKIKLEGLTVESAADTMLKVLMPYFEQEPIVNVRLANFKINVNGEVSNPGIFSVQNERVTILDAITLAGDFTDYSRRDSILIIREQGGERQFGYIDLNTSDAFTSSYFYLQQNDVVYVRPAKTKTNSVRDPSTRFLPWVSVIASLTAITVSIIRLR